MKLVLNDGGRANAGYKGTTGDCVVRSIAIVTEKPYQEVYNALNDMAKCERPRKGRNKSSARNGVKRATIRRYLESLALKWTPCMGIGTGCRVHLVDDELPMGRLVVSLSKHLTAVINGVIHDTYDPQRATIICENGIQRIAHRCVYGYWNTDG